MFFILFLVSALSCVSPFFSSLRAAEDGLCGDVSSVEFREPVVCEQFAFYLLNKNQSTGKCESAFLCFYNGAEWVKEKAYHSRLAKSFIARGADDCRTGFEFLTTAKHMFPLEYLKGYEFCLLPIGESSTRVALEFALIRDRESGGGGVHNVLVIALPRWSLVEFSSDLTEAFYKGQGKYIRERWRQAVRDSRSAAPSFPEEYLDTEKPRAIHEFFNTAFCARLYREEYSSLSGESLSVPCGGTPERVVGEQGKKTHTPLRSKESV